MKRLGLFVTLFVLVLSALASAQTATKYSLANGCWSVGSNGPLTFKASSLGEYLLYTADGKYLSAGGKAAGTPDQSSIWKVDDALAITNSTTGEALSGAVAPAEGCAPFPEITVNATGTPSRGKYRMGDVKGMLDQHAHLMAFEFLGGEFHCGRPWSPFGVASAMPDCESQRGPLGALAPVQNFLDWNDPARTYDTVGWPTFKDWPQYQTLSFEQTYYKWLERAWMGGLRLMQNNLVENEVLCRVLQRRSTCNDMDAVRLQSKDLFALQDYVDAQSGGPGKGWLRIVSDPFEARRVINQGKLAIVQGIEVSRIFGCGIVGDVPQCTPEGIDGAMEEVRNLGVRAFYPIHKFDNGFGGVKMDGGALGVIINAANRAETGSFWSVRTCATPKADNTQISLGAGGEALFQGPLAAIQPPGLLPVYPPPPHCNTRGLTALGDYVVQKMIDRGFMVDIDHMSGKSADDALNIAGSRGYAGVLSSHSWSTDADYKRIRELGGMVSPMANSSTSFVEKWRKDREENRTRRYRYGIGFGSDMNGLAAQGGPRPGNESNPVAYPFRSGDGAVTFDRQVSGSRTFDINTDGVAQYGLMPDWVEDVRKLGGDQVVKDLFQSANAYLETWERASGVPGPRCVARSARLVSGGIGPVRIGADWRAQLRAAGQPRSRAGRGYRWCVAGGGRVAAVFSGPRVGFVATTSRSARRALRSSLRRAKPFGKGVRAVRVSNGRKLLVRGRVVAVASRKISSSKKRARAAFRAAKL